ncbi:MULTISPECIES: HK97 gp10 family phage protein [unclassified Tatumella]|uniref:HK97 gp10 family phage protein n=1 Tax=unclassified Tatumella TaxID=2649542 RepID=UPI001BB00453|nr:MULTISPECIES: HK97 gp10 family phage protein [unclassified Tatumella]MBS0854947.1 HK97 gp10 family phage protein [Tatumella sp. JGM16]MBS0912091.1 HK97 gp10 family phage protein [Tatumella sp. JGM91]
MGIKVRGIQASKKGLDALVNDIQGRRAPRAAMAALDVIGLEAATITPVETSTLINSQFREVMVNGTLVTGRVGYSANYAVYVHNAPGKLKGRPRSSGDGNYWDTNGEPRFLTVGAERTEETVAAVVHKEMSR